MSKEQKMIEDLMNVNSIYYKLLLDLYNSNKEVPLVKAPGRELHHKIPRFYFKMNNLEIDNSPSNLVSLSKVDHLLAHYYIWRGANEKYVGKSAAPVNFMLRYAMKGISTLNITDEDIIYIEKLMKNGSGNLTVKGTHWFNNGEVCIMAKECPEGFVPGRINIKKYAEIRLLANQERKKVAKLARSEVLKKSRKREAEEYFENELRDFSEDYRKLALDFWNLHIHTASQIVKMLSFFAQESKKDEYFFQKLKYTLLHFEEYENLWKEQVVQNRKQSQKISLEELKSERKEQRDIFIKRVVAENPNHSKFWYKEFFPEYWQKQHFKVSLKENKNLLALAYRKYPHDLGYNDFRNFFTLNKLSIIEYLEKNGYIEENKSTRENGEIQ